MPAHPEAASRKNEKKKEWKEGIKDGNEGGREGGLGAMRQLTDFTSVY